MLLRACLFIANDYSAEGTEPGLKAGAELSVTPKVRRRVYMDAEQDPRSSFDFPRLLLPFYI